MMYFVRQIHNHNVYAEVLPLSQLSVGYEVFRKRKHELLGSQADTLVPTVTINQFSLITRRQLSA